MPKAAAPSSSSQGLDESLEEVFRLWVGSMHCRLWMRSTMKLGAIRLWSVSSLVWIRQVRAEKALPLVPAFTEKSEPVEPLQVALQAADLKSRMKVAIMLQALLP